MIIRTHTLVAVALIALAACDQASQAPEPTTGTTAPAETPSVEEPQRLATQGGLTIDGEGLRHFSPEGAATPIPFGTAQNAVLTAVAASLGGNAPAIRTNGECGAGPTQFVRFRNGLQLDFQAQRFVGWTLDQPGLTTADGVGVGSARSTVEDSRTVELVPNSTLGVEFSSGDLGGFFDGNGADAKVVSLYAGQTCFFR